ncbi:MAG: hypothetical protein ACRD1K_20555 [Acidimicrobiales bacterium]
MSDHPHPLSIKPYAAIGRAGKSLKQRQRILAALEVSSPLNRRMLSAAARLPINVGCWRVKGMLDAGLLRVAYIGRDPVTDQDTEFLEPVSPAPVQRTFVWPS